MKVVLKTFNSSNFLIKIFGKELIKKNPPMKVDSKNTNDEKKFILYLL